MANVEKYRDVEGRERYAARWREGKRQMKVRRDPRTGQPFKSKAAAQKYANEQEADARRGLTPVRSDATLGEYARYWAGTRGHRPTTARRLRYTFKHFEATGLADRKLSEIVPSQVQAWASDRAQVLAASTLKKALRDMGSVFRAAEHDRLITRSPVVKIQLPESEEFEHVVPLTVADVEALAAAMQPRYRAMVYTQAWLGLRLGELVGLRMEDVDLEARQVHVQVQFVAYPPLDANGNRVRTPLKTRTSKRKLRMPLRLVEQLHQHLATYPAGADGTVFTTSTGSPLSHVYYGLLIRKAAAKAGLPDGTTSHDLRHHFATELLGAGLTSVEVGHMLGHRDGVLVEKVYGHSRVDAADRAAAALDALYAA